METEVVETAPAGVEADVLVFPMGDAAELPEAALDLDRLLEGALGRLLAEGELKGELGRVTLLHSDGRLPARRVVAVGVGKADALDADAVRTAAAAAAAKAREVGAATLAWVVDGNGLALPSGEQARALVEGTALGSYDAGRWKTDDDCERAPERLLLCGAEAGLGAEAARAAAVVAWTNRCRDLVNAPANELTPEALAAFAAEVADRSPAVSYEGLGPDEIREAGMGALAAVARGSDNPARLITLRYEPGSPARADFLLGLVGKAITFDSGGLSLKPAGRMEEMKSDMGGGAAVLAAVAAIAELEVPLRIVAVVPATENMPGGHASRPGDIVAALNGKTIEITNTDAEGRLVLADALTYARRAGATHLVDLATLTGGIVVALGDFYAGLVGNDAGWVEQVRAAAEASGDHAWTLPLHDTYRRYMKSSFADMKNSSELRQASPLFAARFLAEFAGEGPWAHLDIAGTAYLERGREDYYGERGATGYGVRLLAELARRLAS